MDVRQRETKTMGRLIKLLFFLLIIGGIGLVGFAYLGDLSPEQTDISQPVDLNAG